MCELAYFLLSLATTFGVFPWNIFVVLERPGDCMEIVMQAIIVTSRATTPASLAKLDELHTKC
jgi:hypothetical protein